MTLYRYARRFIDPRNQYRRWIDPRVRTLRLADVVAYLLRRGWREVSPDRPGCRVFREPPGAEVDGEPFYQFVPDSEGSADYPLRMFELLTGLAEFEDRQASEVIDDLVSSTGPGDPNGAAQDRPQETEAARE